MIDETSGNKPPMRVRSRGRPRYLIRKRKVSADHALGLMVVVMAQNGKPVLRGVKDMRIPGFPGSKSEWQMLAILRSENCTGSVLPI